MVRTLKIAAVSGACLLGAISSTPALAADPGVASEKIAMVRVQIHVGDKIVRAPIRAVPWGELATFELEATGHHHVVDLRPTAQNTGAAVLMTYERDGALVVDDTRSDVKLRRATPVFADDASSVVVTIIPTRVSVGTE